MDRGVQKYQRRNVFCDDQQPIKRQRTNWYESSSSVRGIAPSERGSRRVEATPPPFFSLNVRFFDQRVSNEELQNMLLQEFNRFGSCNVRLGRKFGHCEGVAMVDYRYSENAWRAREALNNRMLVGKQAVQIDAVYQDKMGVEPDRCGADTRNEPYIRSSTSYSSAKQDVTIPSSFSRPESFISGRSFSNERDRTRYNEPEFNSRVVRNVSPYRGPTERNYETQKFGSSSRMSVKPHEPMCPEDDELATRSLFIGNLDADISQEDILSVFERYGKIEDIDIKRGDGRIRSSTFAFVKFANLDMAYNCIVGCRGKSIRGLIFKIGYAKSRPTCVVWMSGISHSLSLNDVKCGVEKLTGLEVLDIRKAGDNPGHAYVTFQTVEESTKAMRILRGRAIDNGGHRLRVDYAEAAGVRQETTVIDTRTPRSGKECGGTEMLGVPDERGRAVSSRSTSLNRNSVNHIEVTDKPVKSNQTPGASGTVNTSNRHVSTNERTVDLSNVETFVEILNVAPTVWSGALTMKNSRFMARLLHVGGSMKLIEELLDTSTDRRSADGSSSSSVASCQLKISQRLHIDEQKLEDVRRKMGSMEHCVLVALPPSGGSEGVVASDDGDMPVRPLRNLILYLKQKDAAGIVSLSQSGGAVNRSKGLLHAFPSCDFSKEILRKYVAKVTEEESGGRDHLVVIVIKS